MTREELERATPLNELCEEHGTLEIACYVHSAPLGRTLHIRAADGTYWTHSEDGRGLVQESAPVRSEAR